MFHLLNDFSGSPLVLKNSVLSLCDTHNLTICTSSSKGFLSDLSGVHYAEINYEWSPNKWLTFFRFLKVQIALFLTVIRNASSIDIVYVNTLLPFGAALGAKLMRKKVVYHLHEPQVGSSVLFKLLYSVSYWSSNQVIFVSDFLQECFPNLKDKGWVIYNVLSEQFISEIQAGDRSYKEKGTVLMLCSFKSYKGIYDFVALAKLSPTIKFELVLNASTEMIKDFKDSCKEVLNLIIYPSVSDVHVHYRKANVILNLSHPEEWTESFGMTVLEGLAYGKPCIVPRIGGAADVIDITCGYSISYKDKNSITQIIEGLYKERELYDVMSENAFQRSMFFSFSNYATSINSLVSSI